MSTTSTSAARAADAELIDRLDAELRERYGRLTLSAAEARAELGMGAPAFHRLAKTGAFRIARVRASKGSDLLIIRRSLAEFLAARSQPTCS